MQVFQHHFIMSCIVHSVKTSALTLIIPASMLCRLPSLLFHPLITAPYRLSKAVPSKNTCQKPPNRKKPTERVCPLLLAPLLVAAVRHTPNPLLVAAVHYRPNPLLVAAVRHTPNPLLVAAVRHTPNQINDVIRQRLRPATHLFVTTNCVAELVQVCPVLDSFTSTYLHSSALQFTHFFRVKISPSLPPHTHRQTQTQTDNRDRHTHLASNAQL